MFHVKHFCVRENSVMERQGNCEFWVEKIKGREYQKLRKRHSRCKEREA
jgi:hypothetical protein